MKRLRSSFTIERRALPPRPAKPGPKPKRQRPKPRPPVWGAPKMKSGSWDYASPSADDFE